jgi:hypothetical protein
LYQAEIPKLHSLQWTLEAQCLQLESAVSTADAFQAMTAGIQTLKALRMESNSNNNASSFPDSIDQTMMELQDELQLAQQVNQALEQGMDWTTMIPATTTTTTTGGRRNESTILTDDDLLRELEELQLPPPTTTPSQQQQQQSLMELKAQLEKAENGATFQNLNNARSNILRSGLTSREAEDYRRLQVELAMC